eukprot:IDg6887t1
MPRSCIEELDKCRATIGYYKGRFGKSRRSPLFVARSPSPYSCCCRAALPLLVASALPAPLRHLFLPSLLLSCSCSFLLRRAAVKWRVMRFGFDILKMKPPRSMQERKAAARSRVAAKIRFTAPRVH